MPLLLATGVGAIWASGGCERAPASARRGLVPLLLTVAFAAICVQTYLHTSMRSPYTYLAFFQSRPKPQQHWYHVYHFRDGTGASEGDQFVFTPLEEYFQGAPARRQQHARPAAAARSTPSRRSSYFINTFYVWLGLNCLFWLAAVAATGRWVGRVATPRVGPDRGRARDVRPGLRRLRRHDRRCTCRRSRW